MAIWQFDLHLVPRSRVIGVYSSLPKEIERDVFDSTEWWENYKPPSNFEELITSFLPANTSWIIDTKTWGEEDSHRVDVMYQDEEVSEIYVRIDVRKLHQSFVGNIVNLARDCDCLVLTQDKRLLEPHIDKLTFEIERSSAFQFVENPEVFFNPGRPRNHAD